MDNNNPPDYAGQVARHVADTITEANRSLKSISDATGIPYTTLQRRIASNGNSPFSVRELHSIARALDLDVADLMPRPGNKAQADAAAAAA